MQAQRRASVDTIQRFIGRGSTGASASTGKVVPTAWGASTTEPTAGAGKRVLLLEFAGHGAKRAQYLGHTAEVLPGGHAWIKVRMDSGSSKGEVIKWRANAVRPAPEEEVRALPTDFVPAPGEKAAPPVVVGVFRIFVGVLLFYLNMVSDWYVLCVYRDSEPMPAGQPSAPPLWGNLVVANYVLQGLANYVNGSEGGGGRWRGLLGALHLLPLSEACQGAGRGTRDGKVLARAKYLELWLENVPQGALQLFTFFAFGRVWAGKMQGNTILLSAMTSIASGAFTMATHHELFDVTTFGATAVDSTPVLARFGLAVFTLLDQVIHTLMLAALGTAFRSNALGFVVLGMLCRMVIFTRIEQDTPTEQRWGGGGCGTALCALAFSLPMSALDLLVSERFGTKPLTTLMVFSFCETMVFSSIICTNSENLTPAWWGCSCKSADYDAVFNGLDYCFPEAADFFTKINQPATSHMLTVTFVLLWLIKVIAFGFLSMCSRHASKVYMFQ